MRIARAMMVAALATGSTAVADELEDARSDFLATFGRHCLGAPDEGATVPEPDVFSLRFKASSDGLDAKPRELRLYRFLCEEDAYNASHVFFAADEDGVVRPVFFSMPTYAVSYDETGAAAETGAKVSRIQMTGIASYAELANSEIDSVSGTITATDYWRGAGDASAVGEWRLLGGVFTLVRYDVDASYDGQVNPVRLVNYLGTDAAR